MTQQYQLLYASELAPAQSPTSVSGILRVARVNNARDSISGLLIFDGLRFCQYLEGPRENVLRLVAKIAADERHVLFQILEEGLGDTPRFTQSPMAYALSQSEDAIPDLIKPNARSSIARLELLLPALVTALE